MITKDADMWHFYFHRRCDDTPTAILATIDEMFEEMAQMGDECWYMRAAPVIGHCREFGDDDARSAVIFCRFSTKPRVEREIPTLLGFGKESA